MVRNLAILVLLIPGIFAAIGIKLMRDTMFDTFHPIFFYSWIQFVFGLLLFLGGLLFIGGFIVFRDRKNKRKEGKIS